MSVHIKLMKKVTATIRFHLLFIKKPVNSFTSKFSQRDRIKKCNIIFITLKITWIGWYTLGINAQLRSIFVEQGRRRLIIYPPVGITLSKKTKALGVYFPWICTWVSFVVLLLHPFPLSLLWFRSVLFCVFCPAGATGRDREFTAFHVN